MWPLGLLSFTFIFSDLCEFTLWPLLGYWVGCVPQGIIRVVLKGHTSSRGPLGMLLSKALWEITKYYARKIKIVI